MYFVSPFMNSVIVSTNAIINLNELEVINLKTILILGAAGQISTYLTDELLKNTDYQIKLLANRGKSRIKIKDSNRETVIDGDFGDQQTIAKALDGVDAVYLNEMRDINDVTTLVNEMSAHDVHKLIAATVLGIQDEVKGKFGDWNTSMIASSIAKRKQTAAVVESSDLDYTLLRLAWLFNNDAKFDYETTASGTPFGGTEVSRQAVAKLIVNILTDDSNQFSRQSIGVNEPNTQGNKPSFY